MYFWVDQSKIFLALHVGTCLKFFQFDFASFRFRLAISKSKNHWIQKAWGIEKEMESSDLPTCIS
jgi:hypothetical protein